MAAYLTFGASTVEACPARILCTGSAANLKVPLIKQY
jgi:hypothetical protein